MASDNRMANLAQPQFESSLIDFILEELPQLSDRPRRVTRSLLTAETPIFENGFVDSLGFVHLLAYVEDILDISISEERILMRNFRCVRAIWEAFGDGIKSEVETHDANRRANHGTASGDPRGS